MSGPVFSHAIDSALRAAAHQPVRTVGGYGKFPRSFVALKTAKRLVDMGFAVAVPKLGASGSHLELTPEGCTARGRLPS